MKQIRVEELDSALVTLGVAQEQLERAHDNVENAEMSYRFAIKLIEAAMGTDQVVIDARSALDRARQIEADATTVLSNRAITAWEAGLTDGVKEWKHLNWEIRLRTTRTPVVKQIKEFITHLINIDATAIINRITLHKKDTLNISDTIKLAGLEIEEKTTCSVKRA